MWCGDVVVVVFLGVVVWVVGLGFGPSETHHGTICPSYSCGNGIYQIGKFIFYHLIISDRIVVYSTYLNSRFIWGYRICMGVILRSNWIQIQVHVSTESICNTCVPKLPNSSVQIQTVILDKAMTMSNQIIFLNKLTTTRVLLLNI